MAPQCMTFACDKCERTEAVPVKYTIGAERYAPLPGGWKYREVGKWVTLLYCDVCNDASQ